MKKIILLFVIPTQLYAQGFSSKETGGWEKQSARVTIYRDHYGVPHIYGKTDADAVFGLMYAQCEDDFSRVEMNYIEKLGRMSEVKGRRSLYDDLLIRMIIDTADAMNDYRNAPTWMQALCQAYADGINYFLFKHPDIKPALLTRFEPWYPFLWTDGSIGAINTAGLSAADLKNLYPQPGPVSINMFPQRHKEHKAYADPLRDLAGTESIEEERDGSNGFAFSPKITESGKAILYINPHVTFYFRPEVHMVSGEGLNVYGAVTWGQFFVYQGFNEHCGWMHTSSAVDAADTYIEKFVPAGKRWNYEYDGKQLPVKEKKIMITYREGNPIAGKNTDATLFTVYYTHHGPVMGKKNDQWLSVRADNRIANGLMQCWLRNKAGSYAAFKKTLDLKGNISNNTVYADAEGNIAYWHGNRIPVRDPKFDWTKPVDGSTTSTEWKGYHPISETVQCINPPNGWLQNCNSTPYTVAGPNSPKKENYPVYMAPDPENFRGLNAVRTLGGQTHYNLEKVIAAGYDTRIYAFEILVPALIKGFETGGNPNDMTHQSLKDPIAMLKQWDYRCGENSIPTTLAITWGEKIAPAILRLQIKENPEAGPVEKTKQFASTASFDDLVIPFQAAINELVTKFGSWQIPWGTINRFQRISGNISNTFDDNQPSFPVGFVSSAWGMLPSYISRSFPGTQKRYGEHGNSFVCVVEFGKRILARSLLAGGESGHPDSPHFFDQGLMYTKGQFKEVLFYKEDVLKQAVNFYHPGEE